MARRLLLGSKRKVRGMRRHLRHLYALPETAEQVMDSISNHGIGERSHVSQGILIFSFDRQIQGFTTGTSAISKSAVSRLKTVSP